ncbi:mitogen-activated protein kinase, putative [Entamoeba histolytica HM-1:IMSS-B]|uniref:Mitogen-activated protein kinase n=10 Tax=Entamoeba TaxID=5758 RepID=A0A8U0WPV9_ENTH1|nr:mitogen-activated protein kinase [Entamoeba nuttalli P19]XP_653959.1 mitogen-activated protein kinase [Entamoeba histolytica HM-1:IMSS]AAS10184.1 mitogen-activated protein kinase [Entamoeba histolytica]EMD42427.1 mitogenactivated protein kinase, putative [Entamoeba histolytica KU27]EMH76630.1 mitogen-activated protein kinase, putative [Entamoeba histolytica HM-1:IMSS-B]EMS17041.1 mitogen-activated protein kinase [Entamoeba histolytica HM-3:IMSS]ENY60704.1 mitogen-activated protein kinase, |eukprot:XP_008860112.1 mitogen-activated protein kinase [Entamoeba nuttalli P19]
MSDKEYMSSCDPDEELDLKIAKKYDIVQKIGKGAYGVVWKAVDKTTHETVALKKIFDAFQNATDAQRTFREIMYLQRMDHENIVQLVNVMKAENNKDIYLAFEYMETDLHAVIRANILEDIQIRYIIYQLLKALKYLHSAGIVHRDIKPSNLLLNSDCLLKVADFGLARSLDKETLQTDYVETRWYRAPEILLGSQRYSFAIDLWSVGCILGEIINGKPLFPGSSTLNQLDKIIEATGQPSAEDLEVIDSPLSMNLLSSLPQRETKGLAEIVPKASDDALELMEELLTFNPEKRATAEKALESTFVADFHDPNDEPSAPGKITIPITDNHKYSINNYRGSLYVEIMRKYPQN